MNKVLTSLAVGLSGCGRFDRWRAGATVHVDRNDRPVPCER